MKHESSDSIVYGVFWICAGEVKSRWVRGHMSLERVCCSRGVRRMLRRWGQVVRRDGVEHEAEVGEFDIFRKRTAV